MIFPPLREPCSAPWHPAEWPHVVPRDHIPTAEVPHPRSCVDLARSQFSSAGRTGIEGLRERILFRCHVILYSTLPVSSRAVFRSMAPGGVASFYPPGTTSSPLRLYNQCFFPKINAKTSIFAQWPTFLIFNLLS